MSIYTLPPNLEAYLHGQPVLDKLANSLYPRSMPTDIAEHRLRVLTFWKTHGLSATQDAFGVSRTTLYRWQEHYRKSEYRLESLTPHSRARRTNHERCIDFRFVTEVVRLRKAYPRLGKEKLFPLLAEQACSLGIAPLSVSSIGRLLGDLKRSGSLPSHQKLQFRARSGRLVEKKFTPRPKRRRAGYQPHAPGDLVQIDTVVTFIDGLRRYTITAIDLTSRFAFAWSYPTGSSNSAKDFFQRLTLVAPFPITRVQTDNGSEFLEHFRDHLEEAEVTQFFNYPRRPQWNGTVERFNRTIQEEFLSFQQTSLAYDLPECNRLLSDWLLWYNSKRTHHSLKASPLDFLIRNHGLSHLAWTHTTP